VRLANGERHLVDPLVQGIDIAHLGGCAYRNSPLVVGSPSIELSGQEGADEVVLRPRHVAEGDVERLAVSRHGDAGEDEDEQGAHETKKPREAAQAKSD